MRAKWKHLIGRSDGKKVWSPSKDSRVCSSHFMDGKPTSTNPLPTVNLGYEGAEKRARRMALFEATKPMATIKRAQKPRAVPDHIWDSEFVATPIYEDPVVEELYQDKKLSLPWPLVLCLILLSVFKQCMLLREENSSLKKENRDLKKTINELRNHFLINQILKDDNDVTFYTGVPTLGLFNKLHNLIAPFVKRRWTGAKSALKTLKTFKSSARLGPTRKLSSKVEFLMMLMKLRLGLLNKDLAKRFKISETLFSRIFFAWLRAACVVLQPIVFVNKEEDLIASKPKRFKSLPCLHSIIDCTEIFIETPKDLYLQSATWSDYKHHNTLKLLVACAPNSQIMFVSPAYLGRISDKALTNECGYLDRVPSNFMIMADKGFNISKECEDRGIHLYVPPGRRGQSQMSSENVHVTKTIANHRILIEQVIRRLKTFRILSSEVSIQMISHIDDIVTVCAAICNMKTPIYKF